MTTPSNDLRARFNPDGSLLRCQQLRMLEMLEAFDDICRRHHIRYWLSSGTALGCARHQGFIPWDDDLDVEMLREDYVRLLLKLGHPVADLFTIYLNYHRDRLGGIIDKYQKLRALSDDEKEIILDGCLMNYYAAHPKD